jgi:hypothetical protein
MTLVAAEEETKINTHEVSQLAFERMFRAVEKVLDPSRRAVAATEGDNIPYAVIGGHAVAAWVGEVDEAAVRATQDVDILLRRADDELKALHSFRALDLGALVRMKLTSYCDKDRTHIRDMIDVGLIDESLLAELSVELGERLRVLLDNPEG